MYCQRLARAYTGRTVILKFEGAYHGANETGVTSLFPDKLLAFPQPDPSSAGIAALVQDHVLVAPYNDIETTRRIIAENAPRLAAVIAEPLPRFTPPLPGFLAGPPAATAAPDRLPLFRQAVTGL